MSVVYCRPELPVSKPATIPIAIPSVAIVPTTAHHPVTRFGRKRPTSPKASGSQRRTLIIGASPSRARDQEVEGEAGEADEQEQRVAADEAVLDGADDRARLADRLPGAGDQAVDDEALEAAVGEAADRQRRPHHQHVDQ